MYANYQTPQKLGAGLTAFGMTPGQTVPIQTGSIGSVSTPLTPPAEDETPIDVDQDTLDDIVSEIRQDLDMPVMGSYEDLVPKPTPKRVTGNIGRQQRIKRENAAALKKWEEGKKQFEEATNQFRYGGIAALKDGGFLNTVSKIGSALAGLEGSPSSTKDSKYENMSREQLIALLKGKETKSQGLVPMIAEYMDISVKNDEALIKMAAIVQRAVARNNTGESSSELLTEEEKKQLLQVAQEIEDSENASRS